MGYNQLRTRLVTVCLVWTDNEWSLPTQSRGASDNTHAVNSRNKVQKCSCTEINLVSCTTHSLPYISGIINPGKDALHKSYAIVSA